MADELARACPSHPRSLLPKRAKCTGGTAHPPPIASAIGRRLPTSRSVFISFRFQRHNKPFTRSPFRRPPREGNPRDSSNFKNRAFLHLSIPTLLQIGKVAEAGRRSLRYHTFQTPSANQTTSHKLQRPDRRSTGHRTGLYVTSSGQVGTGQRLTFQTATHFDSCRGAFEVYDKVASRYLCIAARRPENSKSQVDRRGSSSTSSAESVW